jgi:uncharacterized iron-regulated protein
MKAARMSLLSGVIVRGAALWLLALAGCVAHSGSPLLAPRVSASRNLEDARIIYIGEKHDEPYHHRFQEKIIRWFSRHGKPLTIGMEMLDVTQQAALDDYLKKGIAWSEFSRRTGFDRGWGRTSPAYRRILSLCRGKAIPVIALNAPAQVARRLARNEPLTSEQRRLVPEYPEPPGGFEQFRKAMAGHRTLGSLRPYYEAQRAWDQTMAGRILAWLPNHPGTLVVLLGRFHADPRTGVPWYVAQKASVRQIILLFDTEPKEGEAPGN